MEANKFIIRLFPQFILLEQKKNMEQLEEEID
jgi:hypothetical protein